jgi:hypothetical protein
MADHPNKTLKVITATAQTLLFKVVETIPDAQTLTKYP